MYFSAIIVIFISSELTKKAFHCVHSYIFKIDYAKYNEKNSLDCTVAIEQWKSHWRVQNGTDLKSVIIIAFFSKECLKVDVISAPVETCVGFMVDSILINKIAFYERKTAYVHNHAIFCKHLPSKLQASLF